MQLQTLSMDRERANITRTGAQFGYLAEGEGSVLWGEVLALAIL